MDKSGLIHCIGDSHASFFSGYDEIQPFFPDRSRNKHSFFISYRLGAVLAHSLHKLGTKEKGREKLFQLLTSLEKGSMLLLCFGEIDCRCHLILQSQLQNITLENVIEQCVEKYFSVVDELTGSGFRVAIWGAVPSGVSDNPEYPSYGSQFERNICTNLFNRYLENQCKKRRINFFCINNKLMNKDLLTRTDLFFDSIHLGKITMPYVLRELKRNDHLGKSISYSNFEIKTKILITKIQYFKLFITRKMKQFLKKYLIKTNLYPTNFQK